MVIFLCSDFFHFIFKIFAILSLNKYTKYIYCVYISYSLTNCIAIISGASPHGILRFLRMTMLFNIVMSTGKHVVFGTETSRPLILFGYHKFLCRHYMFLVGHYVCPHLLYCRGLALLFCRHF